MHSSRTRVFAILFAGLLTAIPSVARAQRDTEPAHWAIVSAGGFANDIDGDGWAPAIVTRVGTTLGQGMGRFLIAELTAGYAATSTTVFDARSFSTSRGSTPTTHADVNFGVQVPWIVTPYATLGAGVFHQGGIASQSGSTETAAGGLRVRLGSRALIGTEVRYHGEHYSSFTAHDVLFTGGIGWRF